MSDRQYFLANDYDQIGPIDLETVKTMARDGAIDPSTLVWFHGMADWAPLSSTDLNSMLEAAAAVPPAPPTRSRMANQAPVPGSITPGPILGIGFVDAVRRGPGSDCCEA